MFGLSEINNNKDKFVLSLFYLFVFTIPISQTACSWLLGVLLVASFFINDSHFGLVAYLKSGWDTILYFLVLLLGLFFSEDVGFGFKVIESNLSFIVLPFVLGTCLLRYSIDIKKTIFVFSLGLTLACLICLAFALLAYSDNNRIQLFFSDELTDRLGFHPTYFAYYLIFSITFLLYTLFFEETKNSYSSITVSLIIFLFIFLLLSGGQTTFITFSLMLSFFILKFLTEKQTTRRWLTFFISTGMLSFMFAFSYMINRESSTLYSDDWDRMVLWESAINAHPNFWIGVGTGDFKTALNQYYLENNLKQYATEAYNSHNQFIQTLFSNGLAGIVTLLIMLIRPLYFALRNGGVLEILIFFPFVIYGMTEVFLGRFQGIILFVFLHQLIVHVKGKSILNQMLDQ